MNVLIIEDEPVAARHLQALLLKTNSNIVVDAVIDTVAEGIRYLTNEKSPDLIFTDIQLADGLSFEIFSEVNPPAPLVFTTAFDEYAIKAFKWNSVDYLLKPYKQKDLEFAIEKFKNQQSATVSSGDISELLKGIRGEKTYRKRFLFNPGNKLIPVETTAIACFFAKDKYVFARTVAAADYICDESLDELEQMLDDTQFFRVNRSVILNREFITSISKYFGNRLKLDTNPPFEEVLTVSRERVGDFKKWLMG